MRRQRRTEGGYLALAALLLVAPSLAGCSEAAREPTLAQTRQATGEPLLFLTAKDLRAADGAITAAFVRRFEVSSPMAERFARAYTLSKGPYPGPLTRCLALPLQDLGGARTAWVFVLSAGPVCQTWSQLLAEARRIWAELDVRHIEQVQRQKLAGALAASGASFFTIAVAAHSFRHPLHEAQRGLPGWVLDAALKSGGPFDPACRPRALLIPEVEKGHFEIVRYACPAREIIYSHTRSAELSPSELTLHGPQPAEAFRRLLRVLRGKYGEPELKRVLEQKSALWLRHLDESRGGKVE